LIKKTSKSLSRPTGAGIVLDIGTGDGRFVSESARQNPNKFYIGIDANPRPLEKISEKIHRNPAKGGLPNVLFIQASLEDLPAELDGVADEVHIHFPWGSLLRAVATGDEDALRGLRRVCSPDAVLEILIGLDPERDRSEIERLGLQPLASAYIAEALWALNANRDVAIDVPHVDVQATRVARKIKDFNARTRVGLYDVDPAAYVNIQSLLKMSKNGTDVDSKYVQVGVCEDS